MTVATQVRPITEVSLKDPTRDEWHQAHRAVCEACKGKTPALRLLAIETNGVRVVEKTCACGRKFEVGK